MCKRFEYGYTSLSREPKIHVHTILGSRARKLSRGHKIQEPLFLNRRKNYRRPAQDPNLVCVYNQLLFGILIMVLHFHTYTNLNAECIRNLINLLIRTKYVIYCVFWKYASESNLEISKCISDIFDTYIWSLYLPRYQLFILCFIKKVRLWFYYCSYFSLVSNA